MAQTIEGGTPGVAGISPRAVHPRPNRRAPWPIEFYRSAVGKKWVMAVSGVVLLGFVFAHMIGNLKFYLSKQEIDLYGEALRDMPGHLLPRTVLLWSIRIVLILAFVLHIHAAYALTRMNRRARPVGYQAPREYVAEKLQSFQSPADHHQAPAVVLRHVIEREPRQRHERQQQSVERLAGIAPRGFGTAEVALQYRDCAPVLG